MCHSRGSKSAAQALSIETLARVRLSKHFLLRDFLFSAEAAARRESNLPDDPIAVVRAGRVICETLLEPIRERFGAFAITFGYQSRAVLEASWSRAKRRNKRHSSNPHQWDRGTFGDHAYARVDVLPFCVQDGLVSKNDFGQWVMHNLDIDLLMQWTRSNVFCMTVGPIPRRIWLEWGRPSYGERLQRVFMGANYWQQIYPSLPPSERPKFGPSCTDGRLQWSAQPQRAGMQSRRERALRDARR